MHKVLKQIPNVLTILRMAAVPLFIVVMLDRRIELGAWVFLMAEFTDVLDGMIARRFNFITAFGKIADPLADKLMQLSALFMLARFDMIIYIIPWLVLAKELTLLTAGLFVMKRKVDISSRWFGKLTSFLFFIAIMMSFFGVDRAITDPVLWICVLMAIFAFAMYTKNYFHQVRKHVGDSM